MFSLNRFVFDVAIGVAAGLIVFFVSGDGVATGTFTFVAALLADVVARLQ